MSNQLAITNCTHRQKLGINIAAVIIIPLVYLCLMALFVAIGEIDNATDEREFFGGAVGVQGFMDRDPGWESINPIRIFWNILHETRTVVITVVEKGTYDVRMRISHSDKEETVTVRGLGSQTVLLFQQWVPELVESARAPMSANIFVTRRKDGVTQEQVLNFDENTDELF